MQVISQTDILKSIIQVSINKTKTSLDTNHMTKVIETHPEVEEIIKTFKKETVVEEALRILEAIPEDKWCSYARINGAGQSCALGHYSIKKYGHPADLQGEDGPFTIQLIRACKQFLGYNNGSIVTVNNGNILMYSQSSAKQRVIALLQDMIKAGY